MMYLIFNEDGSIKTKKVNEFIQQGNNYVNAFFVAIVNRNPNTWNLTATFTLPNERTKEVVSLSDSGSVEIEGETYDGRYLTISDAETLLSGVLSVNIAGISRTDDSVLVSQRVFLTVNEGNGTTDPVLMTQSEYQNLVSIIGKNITLSETIYKVELLNDILPYSNWDNGQCFLVIDGGSSHSNHTILVQYASGSLTTLFDFTDINNKMPIACESTISKTDSTNQIGLGFKNSSNQYVFSTNILLESATSVNAGVMSASDKSALDSVPSTYETQTHASSTYETKSSHDSDINDLQEQIDAIVSKSDVVDVVGTYADLQAYDTSKLGDNDVIKVLVDSQHNNQRSYYRFDKTNDDFVYIGSEGEYYTKSESDTIFLTKVDASSTYQTKVTYSSSQPQSAHNGDLWAYESIADDGLAIGTGLTVSTVNGVRTLQTNGVAYTGTENDFIYEQVFENYITIYDDGNYFETFGQSPFDDGGGYVDVDTDYCSKGFIIYDHDNREKYALAFPKKTGVIATTDDVKRLYLHTITISGALYGNTVKFVSKKSTAYSNITDMFTTNPIISVLPNSYIDSSTTVVGLTSVGGDWYFLVVSNNGTIVIQDVTSKTIVNDTVTEF